MADVVMYVDGFNLYYGLKSKYRRKYLWLDLFALGAQLRQADTIVKVRYFTAIVKGDPVGARNQETYLAALRAHRPEVEVSRGRFKLKAPQCGKCRQRWTCACSPPYEYRTWEEKLTDVALGVALVEDAALGVGDASLLVTTDTDLHPAIDASLRIAPQRPLYLACPPGRMPPQQRFARPVNAFLINETYLRQSQLPDPVTDAAGRQWHRPAKLI